MRCSSLDRAALGARALCRRFGRTLAHRSSIWGADRVDGFVADLGKRLAAGPPVALAQSKALLHEGADRTMRDALAGEARAQAVNYATADAPAAFDAFNDKREPTFTGKWAVR
jgi:enoyl-CoA hydratase/carnithine racemase